MVNFKAEIAKIIAKETSLEINSIQQNIEVPKDKNMGDFAFPCFVLARELKKSPNIIAEELKNKIEEDDSTKNIISKLESVSGFLNFYINKTTLVKSLLDEFDDKTYGKSKIKVNKTVLVEYSSPNIAKPFHIGHLKNTVIGHSLYNVYKFLGYNTISLNHLGDYGTQFAKLIEGYKRWGKEYDFSENPIDKMADLYVRINILCNEDENVLNECRDTFKKLEDGDKYCVDLWNRFKELSLTEFNKIYDLLGIKFDSLNGEAFYSDKMQEVIDILKEKNKLTQSQGATVVDLSDKGIDTPCIILKANGSTIYATRDLAAILYRARTYDFDKCLYVVGIEQSLHFKQIFEVAKYLNLDKKYTDGLEHVSYGMIRLPEGKMSSRKGNFVKVNDLLDESISKVKEIINDRKIENKEEVAKQVGIGAVIFGDLYESRVKDQVFDLNQALNFNGETGPYLQYMCVRTKSVLKKSGYIPNKEDIDISKIIDTDSINVINLIYSFNDILELVTEKNEPSILARYLINLAQNFSTFYNNNQILCDDEQTKKSRLYLTYMTRIILEKGLNLLGIEVPEEM